MVRICVVIHTFVPAAPHLDTKASLLLRAFLRALGTWLLRSCLATGKPMELSKPFLGQKNGGTEI